MKEINSESRSIKSDVKKIIFKEIDIISSQVREEITKAMDELHTSRIKIDHEISQRVRKGEMVELKNEINQLLEPKVELKEVQKALDSLQTDISNKLVNTKLELQNNLSNTKENLSHQLSKK